MVRLLTTIKCPFGLANPLPLLVPRHPSLQSMCRGKSPWLPPCWPQHPPKNRSRCWVSDPHACRRGARVWYWCGHQGLFTGIRPGFYFSVFPQENVCSHSSKPCIQTWLGRSQECCWRLTTPSCCTCWSPPSLSAPRWVTWSSDPTTSACSAGKDGGWQRGGTAVVCVGIWESSQHQEEPAWAQIAGGLEGCFLGLWPPGGFSQVDEAVAVLQAHHAKKEAAQKVGAVAAATS